MAWELQNISTASFSFKWEFSVADDVVFESSGSQAPEYAKLIWFMIMEKSKRRNAVLSHGLLGYAIKCSSPQTQRSLEASGQVGETPVLHPEKEPRALAPLRAVPRELHPHGLGVTSIMSQ